MAMDSRVRIYRACSVINDFKPNLVSMSTLLIFVATSVAKATSQTWLSVSIMGYLKKAGPNTANTARHTCPSYAASPGVSRETGNIITI